MIILTAGPQNDVYRFDPSKSSWTELSHGQVLGSSPLPRYSPGFAASEGKLFVFGGQSLTGDWFIVMLLDIPAFCCLKYLEPYFEWTDVLGDFYCLDLSANIWTNLTLSAQGIPPSSRAGHGFAASDGKLFVFGGYYGSWVSSECSSLVMMSTIKTRSPTEITS